MNLRPVAVRNFIGINGILKSKYTSYCNHELQGSIPRLETLYQVVATIRCNCYIYFASLLLYLILL
jgi:hypothetical protein